MYLFSSTPQMWILLAISVALAGVELVTARCSQPQTPDHATLVYERHINPPSSLPNGYTVQVVCDELFLLRGRGNGLMTCSNGRWSNTASCTGICNQERYFKRGRITYSAGNTIARYSCESGYRLEGNRELRCMSDGTWSGERPYCREIPMCEKPELGEHLIQSKVAGRKREELWIVGTILQFSCDVNFSIANDHDAYIECTYTGWNDTVPSCVETQCFRPWQIESGETVILSTAVGGTVTFTCGSGFELVGDSVLTCQGNGQWTGTIPFCYNDDPYGGAMPLKHEYGVDLYFLFDASDRIGYEDFERSKRFAKELIQKIGVTRSPNSLRVGAASFSDHAQISFHTADFQSTDEVISQGINRIQFTGGGTNIDEALRLVSEVMLPQSVQRHGSYKAVFIITDGNRREGGARVPEARTLEERGVKIYCLGIGRFARRDKVLEIGSQPYREHVFMLNDFQSNTQLVNTVINQTEETQCSQPFCDLWLSPFNHKVGADLYFVFDASDSVGIENFEMSKRFATELVRKIGVTRKPNSLRVGAITFSYSPVVNFNTSSYNSTHDVINGINRIHYTGGGDYLFRALGLLLENVIPRSVQREGSYTAVFVITDGIPNEGSFSLYEARDLEQQGVKIYCLGTSEYASREQLMTIGSMPYREHVFRLKDFKSVTQLVTKVINQTSDYIECGLSGNTVPSRGRVVGGNDANPGAWPWQVLLDIRKGLQQIQYKCGGVLIDRYWVLTTASCLPSDVTTTVVLGTTDLSRPPHQQIQVEEAIPHPGYDYDRIPLKYQNDIALLKLREPAVLNANVGLVCLPDKTRAHRLIPPNPSSRHVAILTGWGHNKTRLVGEQNAVQGADRLQQLALPLKSREDCLQSLDGKPELGYFDQSMFCAGYIGSRFGACKGDSGGPLVKKARRQRQRRWTLIGLTSWGRGCAAENELDFFTNVPYFMDWITVTMNPPQ